MFQSNVLNTNFPAQEEAFFRIKDLELGAFLLAFGVNKYFVSQAVNFWALRLQAPGTSDQERPKYTDLSMLDGADPKCEASYRIFLALYNLLAGSKVNSFPDLRAFAVALSFIRMFAEESDCWKAWTDVQIQPSSAFTILTFQTFSWIFAKTTMNIFDRIELDADAYNKYCRPKVSRFPITFATTTFCPACENVFLATNSLNYFRNCPICERKVFL